ncbi:hypothetical protein QC763_0099040 [Podospora pseudopauciseta]|uniref:Uncharacterized protein n=1 Tax=Podospora pseudopauciseta TaxID=2093780 RepID=A0ABR0H6H2_9PEZI|nr:hypothetical protein QC763_0099040 [Podospora pseudopauciseta]
MTYCVAPTLTHHFEQQCTKGHAGQSEGASDESFVSIEQLQEMLESYRNVITDKSNHATDLEHENKKLKEQLSSVSGDSRWKLSSFLGRFSNEKALCTHDTEEYDTYISELEARLENAEHKCVELEVIINHQAAELRNAEQKFIEQEAIIKHQAAKFARDLEEQKFKDPVGYTKVSDNEIESKWKQLRFLVRQFEESHFPQSIDWETANSLAFLKSIPTATKYQAMSPRFLSAHSGSVFMELSSPLHLSHPGHLLEWVTWFVSFHPTIDGKEQDVPCQKPTRESFHEWRSQTVRFANMVPHRNYLPVLVKLRDVVAQDTKEDAVNAAVTEIITLAAELDTIFRTSTADFTIVISDAWPDSLLDENYRFGFPFDPDMMEPTRRLRPPPHCSKRNESMNVDLVIAPGIVKCGTADGKHYDKKRVLVKLEVIYDKQTTQDGISIPKKVKTLG